MLVGAVEGKTSLADHQREVLLRYTLPTPLASLRKFASTHSISHTEVGVAYCSQINDPLEANLPNEITAYEVSTNLFLTQEGAVLSQVKPSQSPEMLNGLGRASLFGDLTTLSAASSGPSTSITKELKHLESAAKMAESISKIAEKGSKIAATVAGVAAAAAVSGGILGFVAAAGAILELAGVFEEVDNSDELLVSIYADLNKLIEGVQGVSIDIHEKLLELPYGTITQAKSLLETYTSNPSAGNFQRLKDYDLNVASMVATILGESFQRQILLKQSYAGQVWWPWRIYSLRVPEAASRAAEFAKQKHPEIQFETILPFANAADFQSRFDYRFAIGKIVASVTTRVLMMKVIEPEFRSTGRYRAELKKIHNALRKLQVQWLQCIQWTDIAIRGFDSIRGRYHVGDIPGHYDYDADTKTYLPRFGIVDTCTGHTRWYIYQHGETQYYGNNYSETPEDVRQRWWNHIAGLRSQALAQMLVETGYADFSKLVNDVEELTRDPQISETVVISEALFSREALKEMATRRWKEIKALPPTRKVSGIIGDEEFPRQLFQRRSPAVVDFDIRTQTPDSIPTFAIKYKYFIAGKPIAPGSGALTANVEHFDALRGPEGQQAEEKAGIRPVNLRYNLVTKAGETQLSVFVEPGVNVSLPLTIEETIESGTTIGSARTLKAITLEEHLPKAFWDWRKKNMIAEVPALEHFQQELKEKFTRPDEPLPDLRLLDDFDELSKMVRTKYPDVFKRTQEKLRNPTK